MELWSSINRIMELHKTIIVPLNLIELGDFNFGISYMILRSHISTSIMELQFINGAPWLIDGHP